MAQSSGSESGILRKNRAVEDAEELLVFGYACKLFRDDEKALYIDQGKHLIPWMGDEQLKIDRYDCRGALPDLKKYEASREGFDAMRWLGLNERDRHLEELCDQERYYSLKINEEEEELYKEEDEKRRKTNAFQYSYDVPMYPDCIKQDATTATTVENEEEKYVPPPILDVPVDIDIPKTVKENARIEKTALFVCKQGMQMEILIKAKQAENPQFGFLSQGHSLYKFYRHVLAAFKNGRYQGYEPISDSNSGKQEDAEESSHYLHPSLVSASTQLEAPTPVQILQIPYKPSANCAYSQLVNRIQGNQTDVPVQGPKASTAQESFGQMTQEQQQYYQYYYAQQYYEYYKQMAMYRQGEGGNPDQFVPPPDFQNLDPNMQNYIQQMAYNQYLQQQQAQQANNNSYAQIVSNVNKDLNPYTASVPQLPQNLPHVEETELAKNPVLYPKEEERKVTAKEKDHSVVTVKKTLLSLAAYGSDSENDSDETSEEDTEEETKEVYKVPTGEVQVVIDKMAVYVSKNGEQFEEVVKAKKDPRFDFLNNSHEYNKYYREKIKECKGEKEEQVEKKEIIKEVKQAKKEKKVIAPVSFSIKKAKEEPPKEIKSALLLEESDEEQESTPSPTRTPVVTAPPTLVAVTIGKNDLTNSRNGSRKSVDLSSDSSEKETVVRDPSTESPCRKREKEDVVSDSSSENSDLGKEKEGTTTESSRESPIKRNDILDSDDPILEMIELTGDISEDILDAKHAEDRRKDKLIAAAREKLACLSRDRALQLERKRKAAAFLKLKSTETNIQHTETAHKKDVPYIDLTKKNSVETIIKKDAGKDSSRRNSVEIIDDPKELEMLNKRVKEREKNQSREQKQKISREKAEKKERKKEEREKLLMMMILKEKVKTKEKEKPNALRSDPEEENENKRRKGDEKKEKKKKSHKRKHSKSKHEAKSKKKSKKRHKKSESDSSGNSSST